MTRKLFVSLFLILGLAAFLISTAASQSNRQTAEIDSVITA